MIASAFPLSLSITQLLTVGFYFCKIYSSFEALGDIVIPGSISGSSDFLIV